jgi:NADPH:quinone reductase-like Zn-dependent oxidoreductase
MWRSGVLGGWLGKRFGQPAADGAAGNTGDARHQGHAATPSRTRLSRRKTTLTRLRLAADQTIAIFGLDPVGLSATQLAHAFGARVIALDTSPARLARARDCGADLLINPAGGLDVDALVTHRWRLDQADEAYRLFDTQSTGKAVFRQRGRQF